MGKTIVPLVVLVLVSVAVLATTPVDNSVGDFTAKTITVDGVKYTTLSDPDGSTPGTAIVNGPSPSKIVGNLVLKDTLEGGKYTVTKIGKQAFRNNPELLAVTLPSNLIEIGEQAFMESDKMDLSVSGGNLVMPATLTTIGKNAFNSCTALGTSGALVIPGGVAVIEEATFNKCAGLSSVTLSNNITAIGDSAFRHCTNLTLTNLPSALLTVGFQAFFSCAKIGEVEMPSGLSNVGESAFEGCTTLKFSNTERIPLSSAVYAHKAFYKCSGITTFPFPASITVSGRTFGECSNLDILGNGTLTVDEIIINSKSNYSPEYAFGDCYKLGYGGGRIVLNDSMTTLPSRAFSGCGELKDVHLPVNLTIFGNSCFEGCVKVDVDNPGILPSGVTTLGTSVFRGCSDLGKKSDGRLVIPENVGEVKNDDFHMCKSISDIYFLTKTEPTLRNASFSLVNYNGPGKTTATVHTAFEPYAIKKKEIKSQYVDFTYVKDLLTVDIACDDIKGGIVPGIGSHYAAPNMDYEISVTPSPGYVAKVKIDGSAVEPVGNVYTIANISSNKSVVVEFTNQYTVTIDQNTNGKAQYKIGSGEYADYTGPIVADVGKTVYLKAIPNAGYKFGMWSSGISSKETSVTKDTNLTIIWILDTFKVTATSGVGGKIQWKVDGEYADYDNQIIASIGKTVWLKAIPDDKYRFAGWSDGKVATEVSYTADANVTAAWKKQYTVTITQTTGGSVSFEGASGDSKAFDEGSSVVLVTSNSSGYKLDKLIVDSASVTVIGGKYTISGLSKDTAATATWTQVYTVRLVGSGTGGSVSFNGMGDEIKEYAFDKGASVIVNFTASEGYRLDGVKINETPLTNPGSNHTIADLGADTTVTVTWKTQYKVSLVNATGGTITFNDYPTETERVFDSGVDVKIKVQPESGYILNKLTVNTIPVTVESSLYTIPNLAATTTVVVSWTETFNVTLTNTVGGNVKFTDHPGDASKTFAKGTDVKLDITPDAKHRLVKLIVNESEVTVVDGKYTILNLSAVTSVKAEWIQTYKVRITPAAGGTVNMQGEPATTVVKDFDTGSAVVLEFKADATYKLSSFKVNGTETPVTDDKYTISGISNDVSITVEWKTAYKVTITSSAGGTVSFAGEPGVSVKTVDSGANVVLNTDAEKSYRLSSLKIDGIEVQVTDGKYTITNVQKDTAVTSEWIKTFTVTVEKGTGGTVQYRVDPGYYSDCPGSVTADVGKTVWLKATAASKYRFAGWSSGSSSSEISFTNEGNVTASWIAVATLTVSYSAGGGSPSAGTKTVDVGEKITIDIVPDLKHRAQVKTNSATAVNVNPPYPAQYIVTIEGDTNIEVEYIKQVTVTITESAHGSISFADHAGSSTVVDAGMPVRFKAESEKGYVLSGFVINGNMVPAGKVYAVPFEIDSEIKGFFTEASGEELPILDFLMSPAGIVSLALLFSGIAVIIIWHRRSKESEES